MRINPSAVMLAIIIVGGLTVVTANSLYPLAKAREDKQNLARSARALLWPEIERNRELLPTIEAEVVKPGGAPYQKFDVTSWETVAHGGLILGLKTGEIEQLLNLYSLLYKANDSISYLIQLSSASVVTGPNILYAQHNLTNSLINSLKDLKVALDGVKMDAK